MMRTYVYSMGEWFEGQPVKSVEKTREGWRHLSKPSPTWPVAVMIDAPKLMLCQDPMGYVLFIDDELLDG